MLAWPDIKFTILIKSMVPPQGGGGGHLPQMSHPGSAIDIVRSLNLQPVDYSLYK